MDKIKIMLKQCIYVTMSAKLATSNLVGVIRVFILPQFSIIFFSTKPWYYLNGDYHQKITKISFFRIKTLKPANFWIINNK